MNISLLTDILFIGGIIALIAGLVVRKRPLNKWMIIGGVVLLASAVILGWEDAVKGLKEGQELVKPLYRSSSDSTLQTERN